MAAWPTSLPSNLNADDYQETRGDGVIRTSMDAGPEFVRRRYSATPTMIRGSLIISNTDVATLDTFYATTTAMGSASFTWTHPRTGAAVDMRFMGPPAYQAISNDLYQVSLTFQIDP